MTDTPSPPPPHDLTDAEIQAALDDLAQPQAPLTQSHTLLTLPSSRRPRDAIACTACPNSLWFTTDTDVKCYCRLMYLLTWTSQEPLDILQCDGAHPPHLPA